MKLIFPCSSVRSTHLPRVLDTCCVVYLRASCRQVYKERNQSDESVLKLGMQEAQRVCGKPAQLLVVVLERGRLRRST